MNYNWYTTNAKAYYIKSKKEKVLKSITLNDDIIASGDNEIEIDTVLKELEEKYGIGTLNNNQPIDNENSFNDSDNNSHNENPPSDENTSSN